MVTWVVGGYPECFFSSFFFSVILSFEGTILGKRLFYDEFWGQVGVCSVMAPEEKTCPWVPG